MPPIIVDVILPLPEGWALCSSCETLMAGANISRASEERRLDEYPPEWLEDITRASDLINDLAYRYGDGVSFRLFDPRSLQGLIKSIRHRIRRYPTFVVAGREKISGTNPHHLEEALRAAGAVEKTQR